MNSEVLEVSKDNLKSWIEAGMRSLSSFDGDIELTLPWAETATYPITIKHKEATN